MSTPRCFWSCVFIWFCGFHASEVSASPYTMPHSESLNLPRSANGRDYALYVWLPDSYDVSPQRSYPVIYATDGYWSFPLMKSAVFGLVYDRAVPECIVVGIGYQGESPDAGSLRTWDLTPGVDQWFDPSQKQSGHADEFLAVIEKEIIPFVQGRYRIDSSFRVLTGVSFGGLFATHVFLCRPNLFNGVIITSPSLWWRNYEWSSKTDAFLNANPKLNSHVYVTWASDDPTEIKAPALSFYRTLKAAEVAGLSVAGREIIGEGHGGTASEAYNRGLRYVFKDYPGVYSYRKDPGFVGPTPIANISTRGWVSGGERTLIAGFVIRGTEPKQVLVRAIGPSLEQFGVSGALPNPTLRVVTPGIADELGRNDDWAGAANAEATITAQTKVGAFPLASASKDAALLLTLWPGTYTAIVDSDDSAQGVALVEVYEVTP